MIIIIIIIIIMINNMERPVVSVLDHEAEAFVHFLCLHITVYFLL